jgi:hypothetical protein
MIVTVIPRLRQILLCLLGDWMSTSIMWSSDMMYCFGLCLVSCDRISFFDTGHYDHILLAAWRDHRGAYDHTLAPSSDES